MDKPPWAHIMLFDQLWRLPLMANPWTERLDLFPEPFFSVVTPV